MRYCFILVDDALFAIRVTLQMPHTDNVTEFVIDIKGRGRSDPYLSFTGEQGAVGFPDASQSLGPVIVADNDFNIWLFIWQLG